MKTKLKKEEMTIHDYQGNRTIIFVMASSHIEYERFAKGDCLNMPDGIVMTYVDSARKLQGFVRNCMVIRLPGCFHHSQYREIEQTMIGLGIL